MTEDMFVRMPATVDFSAFISLSYRYFAILSPIFLIFVSNLYPYFSNVYPFLCSFHILCFELIRNKMMGVLPAIVCFFIK